MAWNRRFSNLEQMLPTDRKIVDIIENKKIYHKDK
jgi:hypothetical protein